MVEEREVPDLSSSLVDREDELAELEHIFKDVLDGRGSTVLLSGEAGIGKTRLLDELIKRASQEDTKVIKGWCLAEALKPFLPLKEALRNADLYHLIAEAPPPKVISAYLTTNTGLLVAKTEREESELDADIFASMLNAVQNFVKDSLSSMGKEEGSSLNSIVYGDHDILIQSRGDLSLAMVIEGTSNEFLIDDMRKKLKEMKDGLGDWDGSMGETEKLKPIIDWFIKSGKYKGKYLVDDAKLKKENFLDNVLLGLQRLSEERPIIFIIDDLQWADPSTLGLFHYLSRNTKEDQILLLGTYRPEDIVTGKEGGTHDLKKTMQNMNREGLFTEIQLERLRKEDVEDFLNITLEKIDFDPGFVQKIHEESGGNPFFLIELIKLLIEEGHVKDLDDTWIQNGPLDEIHIPSKIYDVVMRRLNRLIKQQKDILECASVVGEEFESRVVGNITGLNRIKLLENLSDIEKTHNLIHSTGKKYRFDHKKIREVLYSDINHELKEEYHKIVAESYQSLQDEKSEMVEKIAHHYDMAEDERAVPFLNEAANNSKERYANQEAIDLYKKVLRYPVKKDLENEIMEDLADLFTLTGDFSRALENYRSILDSAQEKTDKIRLYRKSASVLQKKGDFEEVIKLADKGLTYTEKDDEEKSKIFNIKGWALMRAGDYNRSLEIFQEEKEIADNLGDKEEMGQAYHNLGTITWFKGDYETAVEYLSKAIDIREDIEDIKGLSDSLNNMGTVHYDSGDLEASLEYHERSLEIEEKIGNKRGIAMSLNNIGVIYKNRGDLKTALEYYEKSLDIRSEIGDKQGVVSTLYNMGSLYLHMGELDEAMEYSMKSLSEGENINEQQGVAMALEKIGEIHKLKGELDEALRYYNESLDVCRNINFSSYTGYNLCGRAKVYLKMDEYEKALEEASKALKDSLDIEAPMEEFMSRLTIAQIYREKGDLEDADKQLEKSKEIIEKSGKRDDMARFYYEYGLYYKEKEEEGESQKYLKKSREIFEDLGMDLWVKRVQEYL
ncbi:MAG: tetratricopeptide repeat protein, partial [Thermoplasmatota archaeon]